MYSRVYVEITNICNMNCSFCHGHSREQRRMSKDEFSVVLDKLSGHTNYIYYHLMGEPLTHPELPNFLKMAAERDFKSILTTNGTLLKKYSSQLISAGLHKVNISLHSFENGSDEDFKQYMNTVADFADTAANAGIIVVFRLWNNGYDNGKNAIILDFLHSHIKGDWVKNTRGLRIRDKFFLEWGERFGWPDKDADIQGDKVFCYGLRDHFGVLCDGSVVPCCLDSDGIITLGNIFDNNIEDILSSERAKAIVKGFDCRTATEDLCRRCAYAQRFI